MQTEFRSIVQSEYGAPEKVLRIAKRYLKSEEPGSDDVLVKVIARPIHRGDILVCPLSLKADQSRRFQMEPYEYLDLRVLGRLFVSEQT